MISKIDQRILRNLYNETVLEVEVVDDEHIRLHFSNSMVLEINDIGEDGWSIVERGWILPE
jgi:hypothetical protein